MTPGPGVEPGPHWWEASALTTAPSLLPPPPPVPTKFGTGSQTAAEYTATKIQTIYRVCTVTGVTLFLQDYQF